MDVGRLLRSRRIVISLAVVLGILTVLIAKLVPGEYAGDAIFMLGATILIICESAAFEAKKFLPGLGIFIAVLLAVAVTVGLPAYLMLPR